MNFKRCLLLAVFLMTPSLALTDVTIQEITVISNVHPEGAQGFNVEVRFDVGDGGYSEYQVASLLVTVDLGSWDGCLDVEPDIHLPGDDYVAYGFITHNFGPPRDLENHTRVDISRAYYSSDSCDGNRQGADDEYSAEYIYVCGERAAPGGDTSVETGGNTNGKSRLEDHEDPDYDNCDNPLTTFRVEKRFTDENSETPVILDFWCNNGTFNPASVEVYPDNSGEIAEQTFIVENLDVDDDTICTVTERPVNGYDTSYLCHQSQSTMGEDCITWDDDDQNDATDCNWSNVWPGQENSCLIENRPTPVDVSVTKVWDVTNTGGDYFDTTARLRIFCDNDNGIIRPNDNNAIIEPEDYVDGEYTLTVQVIPDWYPTAAKPADQEYTKCWATEDEVYDSAVEETSTCGDDDEPGMMIAVGMGDSCVITNTVFFEGIPTLNQYGMAIMALLMLGMGFVGFRRFV